MWYCAGASFIFSDKQNWWKAPRLVTPTRQKHQTDSLPLPFRPRPRYRRRQGPSRSSRPPRSACPAARFFLGAGAFLTQVQGQTRKCAWPFWLPSLCTFRHALQKRAAFAGSATGAPRDKGFSKQMWTLNDHHTCVIYRQRKASYSTSIGGNLGSPWHLHFDERSPRHLFFNERRLTW